MWTPLDRTRINQKRPGAGMCREGIKMSLQDDINAVYNALKGSTHPDWPEPIKGEDRHPAFKAFGRICDQMPTDRLHLRSPKIIKER